MDLASFIATTSFFDFQPFQKVKLPLISFCGSDVIGLDTLSLGVAWEGLANRAIFRLMTIIIISRMTICRVRVQGARAGPACCTPILLRCNLLWQLICLEETWIPRAPLALILNRKFSYTDDRGKSFSLDYLYMLSIVFDMIISDRWQCGNVFAYIKFWTCFHMRSHNRMTMGLTFTVQDRLAM